MKHALTVTPRTRTRQHWPLAALLIFVIGLAGLASDFLQLPQYRIMNIHLLFGVGLTATVAWCLYLKLRSLGDLCNEFYRYTQTLARGVYILIYTMAGVRLFLYVAERDAATNRNAFSFISKVRPLDDFQVYIAYSLVTVWLIRFCAMFASSFSRRVGKAGTPTDLASSFRRRS